MSPIAVAFIVLIVYRYKIQGYVMGKSSVFTTSTTTTTTTTTKTTTTTTYYYYYNYYYD